MTTSRRIFLKGMLATPTILGAFPMFSAVAHSADGRALTVAIMKPAGDLNPHKYAGLWGVQDLMFEPLIRYGKNGEPLPCLASEWTLEEGGKLFRLKLRQGVTFQDGTPWNAEALMWNLDRWIGKDAQNWMNASRAYQSKKIIDEHTVEIQFKEPVLGLLYEFSFIRPSRFLSPKSVDKDGNYQAPVGTGPWIQDSATNEGSSFRRFDGYWGEKPTFERLELKVLPDSRSRMAALRAGEIDLTGGDFLAPLTANEATTLKNVGIEVTVETGTTTIVMGFNPDRNAALKDARVRKAINLGFDRAAIAQVLYQGLAQPAGNLFSATVPMAGKRVEVAARDTEAAKTLLEEAGWKGDAIREKEGKPLAIELVVSEEQIAGSRAVAEVMQAQLKEIGIDLTIRSIDHASRHSDIPARKYDMAFFLTFGAPYEPYGSIVGLFLSTYDNGVDGKLFVDPQNLDPLVTAVMQASEANIAIALQNIYDWLNNEAAIAPLLYVPSMWAHSPRVKGFQPPATEYDLPYEGITLSEQGYPMLALVSRRIRNSFVLLILATLLCFTLVVSAPGNIAVLIAELRSPNASFEDIRKIEAELGLNDPIPVRYAGWLQGALTGNLGISYKTGEEVGPALAGRIPVTAMLVAGGGAVALLLSLVFGFAGAMWPRQWPDVAGRGIALLGASMPSFFVGALLIYAFAVELRLLPTFGLAGPSSWILPWFTIGLLPAAVLSRVVRVGLEEAMSRPFALTAVAKGLTRRAILFRDALPNIAPTYINALGAQPGVMVVGAVVVEPLFAWHGVGDLFLTGIRFRDFMVVQACLLVFISFFILLNLLVDIGMIFTDPKLRRQGS